MRNARQRHRALAVFHTDAYRYARKHWVAHPWHPSHGCVAAALGARYLAACAIQMVKEITGTDRRLYEH